PGDRLGVPHEHVRVGVQPARRVDAGQALLPRTGPVRRRAGLAVPRRRASGGLRPQPGPGHGARMIVQTVIDGIPALIAPGPGPARGGITFRVGRADETLARAGITHLVEHLALHRLGLTDYHYNGTTGATVTHFSSQGSAETIADYLTSVCAALHD